MMRVTWEDIQRNKSHYALIDVRSPSEFQEATIPGAVNIPLFSDEERAEVGTLYKKDSPEVAKIRGLEIISPKLPEMIKTFKNHVRDREAVVFCWRGGMRSKSIVSVSDWMGLNVNQLQGGYKAYRNYVSEALNQLEWKAGFIVLHGHTGVGKTILLDKLEQRGYPVLNLEHMAAHRGSIFGRIGLKGSHSQKMFDSLLLEKVHQLQDEPYVFVEAESKRIGQVFIPPFVLHKKEQGIHVNVTASLEKQVERIIEEYAADDVNNKEFLDAFSRIAKRLSGDVRSVIEQALKNGDLRIAVEQLMLHYYNPRYQHAREKYAQKIDYNIDADDLNEATNELINIYKKSLDNMKSTVS
jgi:tRNA 2-selenouridine synthase